MIFISHRAIICSDKNLHQIIIRIHLPDFPPIYPMLVNLFGFVFQDLFFSGFGWSNIEYLRITNCEIVIDIMRIKFRVRTRDLFESD